MFWVWYMRVWVFCGLNGIKDYDDWNIYMYIGQTGERDIVYQRNERDSFPKINPVRNPKTEKTAQFHRPSTLLQPHEDIYKQTPSQIYISRNLILKIKKEPRGFHDSALIPILFLLIPPLLLANPMKNKWQRHAESIKTNGTSRHEMQSTKEGGGNAPKRHRNGRVCKSRSIHEICTHDEMPSDCVKKLICAK